VEQLKTIGGFIVARLLEGDTWAGISCVAGFNGYPEVATVTASIAMFIKTRNSGWVYSKDPAGKLEINPKQ
jgi:hypothetical protein